MAFWVYQGSGWLLSAVLIAALTSMGLRRFRNSESQLVVMGLSIVASVLVADLSLRPAWGIRKGILTIRYAERWRPEARYALDRLELTRQDSIVSRGRVVRYRIVLQA